MYELMALTVVNDKLKKQESQGDKKPEKEQKFVLTAKPAEVVEPQKFNKRKSRC